MSKRATSNIAPRSSVVALVLGVSLILASCGGAEPEAAPVDHTAADAAETAEEALEAAEEALAAVGRIEAELRKDPEALAMTDAEEGAGHEGTTGAGDEATGEETGVAEESADGDEVHEEEAGHEPGHWSYEGATGPDRWAEVSADFALCESGVAQSPIDVATGAAFPVGLDDLVLDWQPSDLSIVDNGHTVQANVSAGNQTTFDGEVYDLVQFHFHKPSEHTVDTEPFPMELHFVHATADGRLAVIGVLLDSGADNPAFQGLFEADTEIAGFDLTSLLPDDLSRYRYSGSLTTPPCSEGVNWNMLADPVDLSADQIATFAYDGNARPVQELNGRSVLSDETGP